MCGKLLRLTLFTSARRSMWQAGRLLSYVSFQVLLALEKTVALQYGKLSSFRYKPRWFEHNAVLYCGTRSVCASMNIE